MRSRAEVTRLALSLGLVSTAAQVIVLRELLVVSTGNELTIALTLSLWILAVAGGSHLAGRIAPARRASPAALLIITAAALPFQVVLIRALHPLAGGFGEMLGPRATVAICAAGVLPCAALSGSAFVAITDLPRQARERAGRPFGAGTVYGIEALGAAAAGLALSIYLMEVLNPIVLAGVIGSVCIALTWIPSPGSGLTVPRWAVVLAVAVLTVVLAAGGALDRVTRQLQWGPLRIERIAGSKYSSIVVVGSEGGHEIYENGLLALSLPDPLVAEETVHLPLAHHPRPARVLLVGGAGSGAVKEILKHPAVRSVDYVEADPMLISIVRQFAPWGWLEGIPDRPVRPHFEDGRRFVARTAETFDVILVAVGAPTTLLLNRYYTEEFFRAAACALTRDGLIALKLPATGAYVGPDLADLLSSVANACRKVFGPVRVLPGEYIHILASPGLDLHAQADSVIPRLEARAVEADFVNRFVLWDRLSERRSAELDSVLAAFGTAAVNSDLQPRAFAAAIRLWQRNFGWRGLSRAARPLTVGGTATLLVVLGAAVSAGLASASRLGRRAFPGLLTLYALGLATMATQVLLVLGFQMACGYVYGRVAALIAAFMTGMGLAALLASARPGWTWWRAVAFPGLAALPLLAAAPLVAHSTRGGPSGLLAPEYALPALACLSGWIGGAVFARTSTAVASGADRPGAAASASYCADLIGASVAGLGTALVMVPSLGLGGSARAVALACLGAVAVSLTCRRAFRGPPPR